MKLKQMTTTLALVISLMTVSSANATTASVPTVPGPVWTFLTEQLALSISDAYDAIMDVTSDISASMTVIHQAGKDVNNLTNAILRKSKVEFRSAVAGALYTLERQRGTYLYEKSAPFIKGELKAASALVEKGNFKAASDRLVLASVTIGSFAGMLE